jgi:hypothetical protein
MYVKEIWWRREGNEVIIGIKEGKMRVGIDARNK